MGKRHHQRGRRVDNKGKPGAALRHLTNIDARLLRHEADDAEDDEAAEEGGQGVYN